MTVDDLLALSTGSPILSTGKLLFLHPPLFVRVPAVIPYLMLTLIRNVLRDLREKVKRVEHTSAKAQCIASKFRGMPSISVCIDAVGKQLRLAA